MLIDTHCHLNDPESFPDPKQTIRDAREAGVTQLIAVGVDGESSRRAIELADRFEGVYAIVGWHPNYTARYKSVDLAEIESLLAHPKAVAIGEIGLDFHWSYATLEQQELALLDQLGLAERTGKPIVFHCREAYPKLLSILESRARLPSLFHCFAGDAEDASRAVALDCYFGVDGPVTYKKSRVLREILATLPKDRLVVETDSPYLSPEPFRGKPNQPANVTLVNAGLAAALGITADECAALTTANAKAFFRL